ncbi:MAG: hypothetical protein KDE34_29180, partial [Anaerolineales bacterium]|nr:hypothetical protein [Anaerolineales bacterium]
GGGGSGGLLHPAIPAAARLCLLFGKPARQLRKQIVLFPDNQRNYVPRLPARRPRQPIYNAPK